MALNERSQDAQVASAFEASGPAPRRRRWLFLLAWGLLAGLFAVLALALWLSWSLPLSRALEPLPSPAVVLLSEGGQPFARRGAYKEALVRIATLPPHVVNAFLAIEDRRFYRHFGVDLRGVSEQGSPTCGRGASSRAAPPSPSSWPPSSSPTAACAARGRSW